METKMSKLWKYFQVVLAGFILFGSFLGLIFILFIKLSWIGITIIFACIILALLIVWAIQTLVDTFY